MRSGSRGPRDDFYCWRYQIWYSSRDCVFRHAWRTTEVCATCEQGAANLQMRGNIPPKPRWTELLQVTLGEDRGA